MAAGAIAGPLAYVVNNGSGNVLAIDTSTNAVVNTYAAQGGSRNIAVSADGSRLYVTNAGGKSVSIINTVSGSVVNVPVGNNAWGVAVHPDGSRVYAVNAADATISVIDTANNSVIATINVPAGALSIAVHPDGAFAYATGSSSGKVSIINLLNNTVSGTIPVQSGPVDVVFDPSGKQAYVANSGSNSVSVINVATQSVVNVPTGGNPFGIAMHPAGTKVYVACYGPGKVTVIDTATLAAVTVPVPASLGGTNSLAVHPDGSKVYVTSVNSNAVHVIDTKTNVATSTSIPVGQFPTDIAFKPSRPVAYIGQLRGGKVMALNTAKNSAAASIALKSPVATPYGVAVNSTGTRAFVTIPRPCSGNPAICDVAVVDTATNSVLNYVPVGATPAGVAAHPTAALAYAAISDGVAASLAVINLANGKVTNVPVSGGAENVVVHPLGQAVYVSNPGNKSVTVIDTATNQVADVIAVGFSAWHMVLDPLGKLLYVTGDDQVATVDLGGKTVIGTTPVAGASGIAINRDGSALYVTGWQKSNTVSIVDVATGLVTNVVGVGSQPREVAVDPTGSFVYVSNWGDGTVSIVNVDTKQVVNTISVPSAVGIAFLPAGS
jgi:YVTN family beta-propeller protein